MIYYNWTCHPLFSSQSTDIHRRVSDVPWQRCDIHRVQEGRFSTRPGKLHFTFSPYFRQNHHFNSIRAACIWEGPLPFRIGQSDDVRCYHIVSERRLLKPYTDAWWVFLVVCKFPNGCCHSIWLQCSASCNFVTTWMSRKLFVPKEQKISNYTLISLIC